MQTKSGVEIDVECSITTITVQMTVQIDRRERPALITLEPVEARRLGHILIDHAGQREAAETARRERTLVTDYLLACERNPDASARTMLEGHVQRGAREGLDAAKMRVELRAAYNQQFSAPVDGFLGCD